MIGNGQQNRIELATRPGNGRLVVDVGAIADSALVKLVNCHQLSILLGVLGDAHVVDLGEVATGKTTRFVAIGSIFFCSLFFGKIKIIDLPNQSMTPCRQHSLSFLPAGFGPLKLFLS